jgi:hypothetical protein
VHTNNEVSAITRSVRIDIAGMICADGVELLVRPDGATARSSTRPELRRHVAIGKRVGITDEDLDRLRADGLTGWPYSDAVLIKAVDEIHTEFRISDETWLQLRDRYDVAQLVEVPFVIGFYHLNAVLANSLNVGVLDAPSED